MNPEKLKPYARSWEIALEQRNYELWLAGLYTYDAIAVVVSNALSKKGAKKQKYMEEPIRLFPETESEKRKKAEKEKQKLINTLNKAMSKFKK